MKLLTYFKQLVKPEENWPPGKVVSDLSHTHTSKQAKLVRERERERERVCKAATIKPSPFIWEMERELHYSHLNLQPCSNELKVGQHEKNNYANWMSWLVFIVVSPSISLSLCYTFRWFVLFVRVILWDRASNEALVAPSSPKVILRLVNYQLSYPLSLFLFHIHTWIEWSVILI